MDALDNDTGTITPTICVELVLGNKKHTLSVCGAGEEKAKGASLRKNMRLKTDQIICKGSGWLADVIRSD